MTSRFEDHQAAWGFYLIPRPARTVFRRRVVEARCGHEQACVAFAAAGVDGYMRPAVILYDAVAAALSELPEDERAGIEIPLFGQALTVHGPAGLIREVLSRGHADGLDDVQLAGGIQVVLEHHGYLPRAA